MKNIWQNGLLAVRFVDGLQVEYVISCTLLLTRCRILIRNDKATSSVDVLARCEGHDSTTALQHLRQAVEDGVQLVQLVRDEAGAGVTFKEFALSPKDLREQASETNLRQYPMDRKANNDVATPVSGGMAQGELVQEILGIGGPEKMAKR